MYVSFAFLVLVFYLVRGGEEEVVLVGRMPYYLGLVKIQHVPNNLTTQNV